MVKRVGILGHPLRPRAGEIVAQVADSLRLHGVDHWQRTVWDTASIAPLIRESDLIIAIGGDGAMLRASRCSAMENVPVFGINAGHLGFLTEVSPDGWEGALPRLLSGDFWIEERMMIHSEVWRGEERICHESAVNDVVVARGAVARSVLLEMHIDDGWATSYNADALIIATPTGSTAYALAVGGPILPPELKNILVVPVAPHLSLDRPLVLSEGATVEIVIHEDTQTDVMLNVDGDRITTLQPGDVVSVQSDTHVCKFVRLRERNYFYRSLLDRMEPRMPNSPAVRPDSLLHNGMHRARRGKE